MKLAEESSTTKIGMKLKLTNQDAFFQKGNNNCSKKFIPMVRNSTMVFL
jgi:hypothetical protein